MGKRLRHSNPVSRPRRGEAIKRHRALPEVGIVYPKRVYGVGARNAPLSVVLRCPLLSLAMEMFGLTWKVAG